MALTVLDASVVIAHLDPRDALHDAAVLALLERAEDDLRFPASAYAEALVEPTRAGRADEVRAAVSKLRLAIEPISREIAERAALLRGRERALRLPDALVLGTGYATNADEILTADRRWRRFDRVKLIA